MSIECEPDCSYIKNKKKKKLFMLGCSLKWLEVTEVVLLSFSQHDSLHEHAFYLEKRNVVIRRQVSAKRSRGNPLSDR